VYFNLPITLFNTNL